jgi:hypothetical protein
MPERISCAPAHTLKNYMQINEYLPLNYGIEELLKEFASVAAMPPHVLIARIVNNRWQEMEELLYALEQHAEGSEIHTRILALVGEYGGGDYIYEELKRIDPSYLTPEEDAYVSDDEITGLADLMDADEAMTQ